jgi:hypothetical protein
MSVQQLFAVIKYLKLIKPNGAAIPKVSVLPRRCIRENRKHPCDDTTRFSADPAAGLRHLPEDLFRFVTMPVNQKGVRAVTFEVAKAPMTV